MSAHTPQRVPDWFADPHETDWIDGLRPEAKHAVMAAMRQRHYDDGQYIYRAGDRDSWSFRVVAGTVHIRELDSRGKELLLVAYGPRNCFGIMPAIDGGAYPQDASAYGPVTLDCLHERSLAQLRETWPEIDRALAVWAVRRLREAMRMLRDRTFLDLRRQLAGQIDFLLEYSDAEATPDHPYRLRLTQEMLAASVGATRQAISNVLRAWASAEIVRYHYGDFVVLDRARLRREAQLS